MVLHYSEICHVSQCTKFLWGGECDASPEQQRGRVQNHDDRASAARTDEDDVFVVDDVDVDELSELLVLLLLLLLEEVLVVLDVVVDVDEDELLVELVELDVLLLVLVVDVVGVDVLCVRQAREARGWVGGCCKNPTVSTRHTYGARGQLV